MPAIIKKVARLAGVSPSTVSRVMCGYPNVREETAQKVRQAASKLGYTPNFIAKSLVTRSAKSLNVLLPKLPGESFALLFFAEVIRGIMAYANAAHFDIVVSACSSEKEELETVSRQLESGRVDGVILLASREADRVIDYLQQSGSPFVLVGRSDRYPGVLSVDTDNVKAASDAVSHLISMGHKRIGFAGYSPNLIVSQDRIAGYKRALAEHGLEGNEEWMIEAELLQDGGGRAMPHLMSLDGRPTALVAMDDMAALTVIHGLHGSKFKLPDDLAIVSLSSIPAASYSLPGISGVDTGIFHLGYRAAQALIRRLQGAARGQEQEQESSQGSPQKSSQEGSNNRLIVPHRLIIRESSLLSL